MITCRFTGGGSMDGAIRTMPAGVATAVTVDREGGRSWYELDDRDSVYWFIGYGPEGEIMSRFSQAYSEAARREREAIEAATRAKGCQRCGLTFATPAAYQVGHDGDRCLGPSARGQLVEVSGIWAIPGTDAARR